MLKKVLATAVFGVSTLSVMAANAAPGIYVTGQLGYANTHMGSKTDMGDDLKRELNLDSSNLSNNGLAGRVALGYQFNPNFAVEMGYMQLKTGQSKGASYQFVPSDKSFDTTITTLSTSLKQNLIDLVGKGIMPLSDKVNVYGKLGVAYLTNTITGDLNIYSSKAGNQHIAIE